MADSGSCRHETVDDGACILCGFVTENLTAFDSRPEVDENGRSCGLAVSEDGRVLGSNGSLAAYHRSLLDANTPKKFPPKAYTELSIIMKAVQCSDSIKRDAITFMQYAHPVVSDSGKMPLNKLAASCLYLAIRMNRAAVSLDELSLAARSTRHDIGSAYRQVVFALNSLSKSDDEPLVVPPPQEYASFLQRHISKVGSLSEHRKRGPIEDTYAELMHWASFSDMFPAATTPALAAAVLWIAIQANQVKNVKSKQIVQVFDASASSINRNAAKLKEALKDTACLLKWLKPKVDKKDVLIDWKTIVTVPLKTKQNQSSPKSASQTAKSPTEPSKRKRSAAKFAVDGPGCDFTAHGSSLQMPEPAATAAESSADSFDDVIADVDLSEYLNDPRTEAKRLHVWQAQQDAMPDTKPTRTAVE